MEVTDMKSISELENLYYPSKQEIDSIILKRFISEHRMELGINSVVNLFNSLGRIGIESLQALYDADLNQIAQGRTIGGKKLQAIGNLKIAIYKELMKEES
jgi:hypothetical protein